jgi:outer membrane protein OmpA-like peptidoglycan-associated protein
MRKHLLTLLFIFTALVSFSQSSYSPSYFGVKLGANYSTLKFDPSLPAALETKYKLGFMGGAYYNFGVSRKFSIQPEVLYSQMGTDIEQNVTSPNGEGTFKINYISVPVLFKLNPTWRFGIFAGPQFDFMALAKSQAGSLPWVSQSDNIKVFDFAGTAGAEFWFTRNIGIFGRYILGFSDINDHPSNLVTLPIFPPVTTPKLEIMNRGWQFGLTFGFPHKIKPPVVVAPPPPPPPADSDGDGIIDALDKCPNQRGVAEYQGCPIPDTDGDGINDKEDKCPNQAGVPEYQGCPIPDSDGDGFNDKVDKCPNQAGVAEYQGCPVPDRDNDGIADDKDDCPDVAGVPEKNGCPDLMKEFSFDFRMVQFVTGSSKLTPKAQTELNKLVDAMNKYPNLKMNVDGHTDNTGKAAANQTLSENRANSVKSYLVKKGISEDRLIATGYGQDRPIGDNTTAVGRAANRRVEFSVNQKP